MLKDCSVQSKLDEELYLNFDEEGFINIVFTGDPYMIMSIEQWANIHNLIDEDITQESLLKDHFDARFD